MPGKLLAARTVDRHNPFRFAQFERGEQRDIIRAGGGRDNGRRGDRIHRLPPCWWWKLSLPSPAAVHPHRICYFPVRTIYLPVGTIYLPVIFLIRYTHLLPQVIATKGFFAKNRAE